MDVSSFCVISVASMTTRVSPFLTNVPSFTMNWMTLWPSIGLTMSTFFVAWSSPSLLIETSIGMLTALWYWPAANVSPAPVLIFHAAAAAMAQPTSETAAIIVHGSRRRVGTVVDEMGTVVIALSQTSGIR